MAMYISLHQEKMYRREIDRYGVFANSLENLAIAFIFIALLVRTNPMSQIQWYSFFLPSVLLPIGAEGYRQLQKNRIKYLEKAINYNLSPETKHKNVTKFTRNIEKMSKNKTNPKYLLENPNFRNLLLLISLAVLGFFVFIIFHRMMNGNYSISYPDIILITIFVLFSSGFINRISEISFGEKGFSARFNKVEQDIQTINVIARNILTYGERLQLQQLNRKEDKVDVFYCDFLFNEMIRLCQHEFVAEKEAEAVWKMKAEHQYSSQSYNLKDYFKITEAGIQYLKLLEKLEKQQ